MRGLSNDFKDGSIYRNALYGFMFGIIAILAGIVVFVAVFFAFFSGAFFIQPFGFGLGILGAVVALVVVFIFFLLEAIFYKQAFDVLSDRSGERLFRTGGLLLLLGAVLTIVIIGFILLVVAWIILAVGFFSMRPHLQLLQLTRHLQQQPSQRLLLVRVNTALIVEQKTNWKPLSALTAEENCNPPKEESTVLITWQELSGASCNQAFSQALTLESTYFSVQESNHPCFTWRKWKPKISSWPLSLPKP